MTETSVQVIEYRTEDGRTPFSDWLLSLRDREGAHRIRVRLARMRLGNLGDTKAVSKGISEVRVSYGPGYRVYFGRRGDQLVVLLCGGDKSSQVRDIEKARVYWADFLRRLS